jgi:flagellar hook-basal body complex protein FliE
MAISGIGNLMNAAGIGSIAPTTPSSTAAADASQETGKAGNAFTDALNALEGTQDAADALAQQAATGTLTDVHNYTIAATQAQLTTELTVAVRDRAVGAFEDIMRMQV